MACGLLFIIIILLSQVVVKCHNHKNIVMHTDKVQLKVIKHNYTVHKIIPNNSNKFPMASYKIMTVRSSSQGYLLIGEGWKHACFTQMKWMTGQLHSTHIWAQNQLNNRVFPLCLHKHDLWLLLFWIPLQDLFLEFDSTRVWVAIHLLFVSVYRSMY